MRKSSSAKGNVPSPPSSAQPHPAAPSRGPQPDPCRSHVLEPDVLDGDMRRSDVLFALEHLEFLHPSSTAIVRIDRDVRDYLLRALDRHASAHR